MKKERKNEQDLIKIMYEVLKKDLSMVEAVKLAYSYGKYESNELGKINQLIDKFNVSDSVVHSVYCIAHNIVLRG